MSLVPNLIINMGLVIMEYISTWMSVVHQYQHGACHNGIYIYLDERGASVSTWGLS
jgi:hypothetical protein